MDWPEGASLDKIPVGTVRTCTVDSHCSDTSRYSCQKTGTKSLCCPKPEYICSVNGGLDYHHGYNSIPTDQQIYDPGFRAANKKPSTR